MNKVYDDSYRVAWEALRDEIVDAINENNPEADTKTLESVLTLMGVLHI